MDGWLVCWRVCWSVGWLICWFVAYLAGSSDGALGWFVQRLVWQLVAIHHHNKRTPRRKKTSIQNPRRKNKNKQKAKHNEICSCSPNLPKRGRPHPNLDHLPREDPLLELLRNKLSHVLLGPQQLVRARVFATLGNLRLLERAHARLSRRRSPLGGFCLGYFGYFGGFGSGRGFGPSFGPSSSLRSRCSRRS